MKRHGFRRGTGVVLSACLLLSPAGCRTGAERAGDHRLLVEVGMSPGEVEARLGEPDGWQENVGGFEVWTYAYRPSLGHFVVWAAVDATVIVAGAALFLGLVPGLAWLTKGHLPSFSDGRPAKEAPAESSGRYQRFTLRIGFDRETGRVAFISSPWPE